MATHEFRSPVTFGFDTKFDYTPLVEDVGALVSTGGRQFKSTTVWYKTDKQAEQFYEMIRNNPSSIDVSLISKNTGMQEKVSSIPLTLLKKTIWLLLYY